MRSLLTPDGSLTSLWPDFGLTWDTAIDLNSLVCFRETPYKSNLIKIVPFVSDRNPTFKRFLPLKETSNPQVAISFCY
jgi:hypothetical protein